MKKKALITLPIVIVVLFFIAYKYLKNPSTETPKRSVNIPKGAKWIGGSDGGNWYQITKILSNKTLRIKIYNDNSGSLETDTTFTLNADCSVREIDSTSILKSIDGYDGEKILLAIPNKGGRCFLIPINK